MKCLLNDCTGFEGIAPCCLYCDQREACPDRCPKSETTYCVGVIDDDSKRVSDDVQADKKRDRGH